MSKKLSKKEREGVVTKGYLHDVLDDKLRDYVTKKYLDEKLDERFEYYFKVYNEIYNDKFDVIFEELRAIREENGRRLEICESRLDRVENKLGII